MADQIVTARMYFQATPAQRREELVGKLSRRGIDPSTLGRPDGAKGQPVLAYVNHGRWVADCPVCNGAELVTPGDPFLCFECLNGDREYRLVMFPSNRSVIEAELTKRTSTPSRNWLPGETVEKLRAENHEHGVGE